MFQRFQSGSTLTPYYSKISYHTRNLFQVFKGAVYVECGTEAVTEHTISVTCTTEWESFIALPVLWVLQNPVEYDTYHFQYHRVLFWNNYTSILTGL